jgi:tRNA pseudouridine55 synthase
MEGIAIIDKPVGLTSHDVVARVRRILKTRRVGHTGTLDPFATGVLVILTGRATRLAQFLSGAEKEYVAMIRFGFATDTGDLTGQPRQTATTMTAPTMDESHAETHNTLQGDAARHATNVREWSAEEIEAALATLRGEIEQVPPMYSAKKVQGKKLYELARQGVEIERAAVRVNIREFESVRRGGALLHRNSDGTVDLDVRVVCSAGTYIRTLAEAVGERLGAGAHLASLRRTRAGEFKIEGALTLEELQELADAGTAENRLLPMATALSALPVVHLTFEEARATRNGAAWRVKASTSEAGWTDGQQVGMYDAQGALLAVGVYDAPTQRLRPRVVLATEE